MWLNMYFSSVSVFLWVSLDESFVLADLIANALPEACSMKILL